MVRVRMRYTVRQAFGGEPTWCMRRLEACHTCASAPLRAVRMTRPRCSSPGQLHCTQSPRPTSLCASRRMRPWRTLSSAASFRSAWLILLPLVVIEVALHHLQRIVPAVRRACHLLVVLHTRSLCRLMTAAQLRPPPEHCAQERRRESTDHEQGDPSWHDSSLSLLRAGNSVAQSEQRPLLWRLAAGGARQPVTA